MGTDLDGESIHMTREAIREALRIQQSQEEFRNLSLRLYLDGKGCDGFFYGVSFDEPQSSDLHFQHGYIDVIVDPDTFTFTKGSLITWVNDERGIGFLVENPHHKRYRGKFYKRPGWRKKLAAKRQEPQAP